MRRLRWSDAPARGDSDTTSATPATTAAAPSNAPAGRRSPCAIQASTTAAGTCTSETIAAICTPQRGSAAK